MVPACAVPYDLAARCSVRANALPPGRRGRLSATASGCSSETRSSRRWPARPGRRGRCTPSACRAAVEPSGCGERRRRTRGRLRTPAACAGSTRFSRLTRPVAASGWRSCAARSSCGAASSCISEACGRSSPGSSRWLSRLAQARGCGGAGRRAARCRGCAGQRPTGGGAGLRRSAGADAHTYVSASPERERGVVG